ncbi:DUF488 domain-containing protein [Sorangium sp. So ce1097]|uniref:DUF488 domain-containing protein n=1 Tax=Sorangium sp. So ce1097 TaxID=3133330 RepID=UPI003F62F6D2
MASTRQPTAMDRGRAAPAGGTTAGAVRLKRAYEPPEAADGYRVLVDRLWPRGVRKEALAIDAWLKEIGPSDELRRWFGHEAGRWEEFASRYRDELRRQPAAGLADELVARARRGTVTLVYGAKDELHNQAVVLRDVMEQRLRRPRARAPAARSAAEVALPPSRRRAPVTRRPAATPPAGQPQRRAVRDR